MKKGNLILKLIFGGMGLVYTVIGGVCLGLAIDRAGSLTAIFALPEDDLAFSIVGTAFAALGIAFLAVTLILTLADKRRARLHEELLTWGQRTTGVITDVRVDYSIRVNGRSPVIASVCCTLPSGEVTLKSHRLWHECPATGDEVNVLYDPMDERRYVIEF